MSVPDFQSFLLPVLEIFSDGEIHSVDECCSIIKDKMNISDEDAQELLPSGGDTRLRNRVYWSLVYLNHALVLDKPKKVNYQITDRGRELLSSKPDRITRKMLREKYAEFADFSSSAKKEDDNNNLTPEDELDKAFCELNNGLADELLNNLLLVDPYKFEYIVMELLEKMDYGGAFDKSVKVTKKSGDDGIDGVIDQDKLGLDKIFVQAKRWSNAVGSVEIRNFIGSLSTKKVGKGIFITTSYFNDGAKECVKNADKTIVLIDGKRLAKLMIDFGVGVQVVHSYKVKKLDTDFFELNREKSN
ncbi:restriction endonuclease [Candidatus Saccharibacteria bacterium]|nr:restriction endonuclease [Candidatus Saccharibacteria bacterium]